MPTLTSNAEENLNLRQRAVQQLGRGSPHAPQRSDSSQALAVLHALASSPETAPDALALLHELQVHQVELELQDEELRRSRTELEADLLRQRTLVEHAPVACVTLDSSTRMHELNRAAVRLLGGAGDELHGQLLSRFLSPSGAQALFTLLARVQDGITPQRCELQLAAALQPAPTLLAVASVDPAGGRCLLALVELSERGDAAAA